MRKGTCHLLVVGVASLGWMTNGLASESAPPVESFGALPAASAVSISPDGNTLAWYDQSGSESKVAIFDLTTRKYRRFLRIDPKAKLRSITWADDETALVTVGLTRDWGKHAANWNGHDARLFEIYRTIAADTSDTPGRMLLMSGGSRALVNSADLIARDVKPKTVLMATLDDTWMDPAGWRFSLFEVDTRTGTGKVRVSGTPNTVDWVTDPSGQHIARKEIAYHQIHIQVLADSRWRDVFHGDDDHHLSILGFSADFSSLFALGAISEFRSKLWALPLDGSAPRVLLEDAERDVTGVTLDPFTGQPLSAFLSGSQHEEKWLNADAEARHKVLARAFPGRTTVDIREGSRSGDRLLVETSSPSSPPVYYLVDNHTHKADIVAEGYPALANVKLGEVRAVTYKARDGTEIPAYLTLPPGVAPQNLPLVVLPHGGPQSRDYLEFDWWAQFLASRGYAVLKPQFRGSSGFGDAFQKAGYHQWGGLMQDDVSDGVAAMISQGVVDAKRVCIVGASYGGYAALAGAAFTPTLYKCAVSIGGVSDLPEMLAYVDKRSGGGIFDYWREHIGAPYDPAVSAKSPVHAADKINIPILLMHATDDTVVPFRQSEGMARALSKAGKPVTFVPLPGEDHWLSRGETRTQMLKVLEQFLAANL